MKRAAAIILSLTLLWLQVLATAQTLSSSVAAAACGCCSGKKICCCVEESAPISVPTPVATAPTASIDFTAVIPKLVAWLLPEPAPAIVSSSDNSASTLAVPLFQRDCALLI
jgi:hypothetical protein